MKKTIYILLLIIVLFTIFFMVIRFFHKSNSSSIAFSNLNNAIEELKNGKPFQGSVRNRIESTEILIQTLDHLGIRPAALKLMHEECLADKSQPLFLVEWSGGWDVTYHAILLTNKSVLYLSGDRIKEKVYVEIEDKVALTSARVVELHKMVTANKSQTGDVSYPGSDIATYFLTFWQDNEIVNTIAISGLGITAEDIRNNQPPMHKNFYDSTYKIAVLFQALRDMEYTEPDRIKYDQQKVAQLITSFVAKLYSDKPFTREDEKSYFIASGVNACLLEQAKADGDEFLQKILKQTKISLFGEYLRFSRDILVPQLSENQKKEIWLNMALSSSSYDLKLLPKEINWDKQPHDSNRLMTVSATITSDTNNPYYYGLSPDDNNRQKAWVFDLSQNDGDRHKTWVMDVVRDRRGLFKIKPSLFNINGQPLMWVLEFKEKKHDFHFIPNKRWEDFKKWLKNNATAYGIEVSNQIKVTK